MNRQQCAKLIEEDVNRIMNYATAIIVIAPDGNNFKFIKNKYPRIGVLAVIGPTNSSDQKFRPKEIEKLNFNKALLMEVGLGGKPYNKARGINKKKRQSYIMKRRKWFCLTEKQYQLVVFSIMNFIVEKSLEKIKTWKKKGYTDISVARTRYYKGNEIPYETYKEWPRGTRFSISPKDNLFIKDILAITKNNPQIQKQINGLYCFVEIELRFFLKKEIKLSSFKNSETASRIKTAIRNTNILLRGYILSKIKEKTKRPFYNDLIDIFGTKEIKPPKRKIPSFFSKIGDVEIKITILKTKKEKEGRKNRKRKIGKRNYISFEMFPHKLLPPEDSEEHEDEVPF